MTLTNLTNLDKEARKNYYRMVSIDDFRKDVTILNRKDKSVGKKFTVKMGKSFGRITQAELADYLEENYMDPADPIFVIYDSIVYTKLKKIFPWFLEFIKLLEDKDYNNLDLETKNKLKQYEVDYEKHNFKLNFEDLTKASCKIDEENFEKLEEEKTQEQLDDLSNSLENCKKENDELKVENKKLADELKKTKTLLERSDKKHAKDLENYKKQFNVKNIKLKLSSVVGSKLSGQTYEEAYAELTDMENTSLKEQSYTDLEKILAAKFAVMKVMKGNN